MSAIVGIPFPYHPQSHSAGIHISAMRISRRHLLALSSAAAAAGMIGVGMEVIDWWDQPHGADFDVLADDEARFVRALALAAYPRVPDIDIDGATANLDHFLDQILRHMSETSRNLIRLLLHGLDTSTLLTDGARFSGLDVAARSDALQAWLNHDLSEVRNAAQSMVLLLGMGWTIHPAVVPKMRLLHSCGYGA
jgi:hypothetical protein